MLSSGSENEFEDADDQLPALPPRSQFTHASTSKGASYVQAAAEAGKHIGIQDEIVDDSRRLSLPTQAGLRLSLSGHQFDGAGPKSTNRHNRLAGLRSRMKSEFSSTSISSSRAGGPTDDEGVGNSQSECTSLASWGRNLLMEHQLRDPDCLVPVISAVDSLSTRGPIPPPVLWTPSPEEPPQTNGVGMKREESVERLSLKSPPPVFPPPPLPRRIAPPPSPSPHTASSAEESEEVRVAPAQAPPPLPPRKQHLVMPSVIALSTPEADPAESREQSPKTAPAEGDARPLEATETALTVEAGKEITETPSSSLKHPDATLDAVSDYGKRRGHVKTNSLDRGLSLAKSMKCGPFPPPSSTKNTSLSLGRGILLRHGEEAMVGECEEDQNAHGVIQQLTQSVLSNSSELASESALSSSAPKSLLRMTSEQYPSRGASKGLPTVGEEGPSSSSATATPVHSPEEKPKKAVHSHYENLSAGAGSEATPLRVKRKAKSDESAAALPSGELLERISSSKEDQPQSPAGDKERPEKAKTSRNARTAKISHMNSIDPITRDLERRMSSREVGTRDDVERDDEQSTSDAFATPPRHGFERAKQLARSAQGLFSGTVEMAKRVAHRRSPRSLEEKRGEDENENQSEEDDEEESVSLTLNETAARIASKVESAPTSSEQAPICRPKNSKKGPFDYEKLRIVQELSNEHTGAVWCVKFSVCGRLFATAGQDNIVRVWVLKNHYGYFTRLRERYCQEAQTLERSSSSTMLDIEALRMQEEKSPDNLSDIVNRTSTPQQDPTLEPDMLLQSGPSAEPSTIAGGQASMANSILVSPKPFCTFRGHTADVLDLSWSPRNYFILSSGMDRTVKLWHLTRSECLCCFQHSDIVTCIAFLKDDRYFISGSMDGKIRLWNISEKKVALWNEVEQVKFITAIAFVRGGKFLAVGTYNGRCFFYSTDKLKYHTVIDVRSSRGKNARGHKITSLAVHGDRLLVTSNDSRIRIYDLRDMTCVCKFKGAEIEHSQIRASFSPDGRHIISGSEDSFIYIWRTGELPSSISATRNNLWERVRGHSSVVTAAVFAPKPHLFTSNSGDSAASQQKVLCANPRRIEGSLIINSKNERSALKSSIRNNNAYPVVSLGDSIGSGINSSSFSSALNPSASSSISARPHSPSSTLGSRERLPMGDVIVSADLNGSLKIFALSPPATTP